MKLAKFFLGIVLLPFIAAAAMSLWDQTLAWIPTEPWRSAMFWSVWGGIVAWLVVFMCLPRPVWVYVLGHELTHALAAYMAGGKVHDFRVSSKGGHVKLTKVNWWITLAPYFVPIYSLLFAALWISINFWYPLHVYLPGFFFGLGFTYAFHVSFTLSVMHPHQSDLKIEGRVFSYSTIVCINILFLWLCLVSINNTVTWKSALWLMGTRICHAYWWVAKESAAGVMWVYRVATEKAPQ